MRVPLLRDTGTGAELYWPVDADRVRAWLSRAQSGYALVPAPKPRRRYWPRPRQRIAAPGTRPMRKLLPAILLGMILMNSSHADDGIHTPEKGSTEREQLLDAARAPVQKKLGRDDVRFEVEQIRDGDGWAFVYVRMLNADGSVRDYAGTPLADARSVV